MMDAIRSFLTRLGELTATPAAFGVLFAYFCLWLICCGPMARRRLSWRKSTAKSPRKLKSTGRKWKMKTGACLEV
jgi:hypothetical protein